MWIGFTVSAVLRKVSETMPMRTGCTSSGISSTGITTSLTLTRRYAGTNDPVMLFENLLESCTMPLAPRGGYHIEA
jgi:hypothetical protein